MRNQSLGVIRAELSSANLEGTGFAGAGLDGMIVDSAILTGTRGQPH